MKTLVWEECLAFLKPREKTAHKYDFGHVLVVGGDRGYGGACALAAEAALRVGAGLVTVATRIEHVSGLLALRPELMGVGVERVEDLAPLLARASVVVLSGLGTASWGKSLLAGVLASSLPVVVDGDSLSAELRPYARDNWVLTPHPGEAHRLLGETLEREAMVAKLFDEYRGTIVLKGFPTVVKGSGGLSVCEAGNPGMASAGMGDVLAGMIGGLIAQKLSLEQAAQLGVMAHAVLGDRFASARGFLARDLVERIPECLG